MSDSGSYGQLRIYLNEDNKWQGHSLAEVLLMEVREFQVAGATVLRGVMGFGSHGLIHSATLLRWTESLPLILEVVDRKERLHQLVDLLRPKLGQCLVTLTPLEVLHMGGERDPSEM